MRNTLGKKHFCFLKTLSLILIFFHVADRRPHQPKTTPVKFRQVWAWLNTPDHTQPTIVVLDLIFPWLLPLWKNRRH